MGEIADSMINGEMCALCGVYLMPGEKVFTQHGLQKMKMPLDRSGAGFPVICAYCK